MRHHFPFSLSAILLAVALFYSPFINAKYLIYGSPEEALSIAQSVLAERAEAANFIP